MPNQKQDHGDGPSDGKKGADPNVEIAQTAMHGTVLALIPFDPID